MRRGLALLAAAVAGAVVGTVLLLVLPVRGVPGDRGPRPSGDPAAESRPLGRVPEPTAEPARPPSPAEDGAVGEARVRTVLAWTPTRLPPGYAEAVRGLRAVRAAAVVRSGTAWLTAWGDRSGEMRRPPDGFRIPVEVAAIAPGHYGRFVPPADDPAVAGLASGGALLGSSGAEVRDIGPGGFLRFGGEPLEVHGVIDDDLVGGHEAVVANGTAGRVGELRPRYLLVAPKRGVPQARLEDRLREVLPPGIRLRIRAPGETPVFRHGDAVLPPALLKTVFGEFAASPKPDGTFVPSPGWVTSNIRRAKVPILGTVHCHRLLIPLLRGALGELARRGLGDLIDPGGFGGCWSPRFINFNPASGISHHAWGVAVDVNVPANPFGAQPSMDERVVEVFEKWGFTWGGRWLVPDGMHFEFVRFPSGA